jgi:hypothetical protein
MIHMPEITIVKVLVPAGTGAVENWSIGVAKIDWQPGVKWYGGILVNGLPPSNCTGYGSYAATRKDALAAAQKEAALVPSYKALRQFAAQFDVKERADG